MVNEGGSERLLRIDEVTRIIPLARSTIWRHVAEGRFPAPVRHGRSTFWKESAIAEFVSNLAA